MKHLLLTIVLVFWTIAAWADKEYVNLTPRAKSALTYDGKLTMTSQIGICVEGEMDEATRLETENLIVSLNNSMTGYSVRLVNDASEALINVHPYKGNTNNLSAEGYRLVIKADSIGIEALSPLGYYYAFQSLKKLFGPNVALECPGTEGQVYSLPITSITDEPRFAYRSFMLDCSRHFFSVGEIKRLLDLMAIYKMNTFHWHLTDDQGWRAEIKKYPKLTKEGATRSKNWSTPVHMVDDYWWTGEGIWDEHTYGPYYYSQDDMRDVVAYAAARHIEVIPEIEMPGHAVAALVAYPEYSCNPSAKREVWTSGGISTDVMNVANPKTMQFLYDIIDEICDIFPGRYFHIGGDECPTDLWKNNADCQKFMQAHNLSDVREIQSYFTNQISGYLATKGKRTIVWNESITADKANLELVTEHNPVIMCWYPCQNSASKAVSLGLDAIITEYHGSASGKSGAGGYYINRKQSNDYGEPSGAGSGDDTVEGCYNYIPVPSSVTSVNSSHYIGVQGTFWCEHVDSDEYLEYLSLPRLIAMAETGWSTQGRKNWSDFVKRMELDTEMLDMGNYVYARHWMPDYQHRVYQSPLQDGTVVQFTNQSTDRPRCLCDDNGTLNGQGSECTNFIIESTGKDGEFYISSEVSGKYLYVKAYTSDSQVSLSSEKVAWTFDETTLPGYVAICPAKAPKMAINNKASNNTKARLFDHGSGNGSSFWKVELIETRTAIPMTPADDTFDISDNAYDLMGRRITRQSKGFRIQKSRKFISK